MRRSLLWATIFQAVAWVGALCLARLLARGDERSDSFRTAAICWGHRFESHAARLRDGSVIAVMGGIDLDLRQATLDPAGARLDVNATMAGVVITLPADWAVSIDQRAAAGGVDATVAPHDELPPDAPSLHINAIAVMGGVQVRSEPSPTR